MWLKTLNTRSGLAGEAEGFAAHAGVMHYECTHAVTVVASGCAAV